MPSLFGYEWLWLALLELDTCRNIGMAVGPIPWTAIEEYRNAHQLDEEDSYILGVVIRKLDAILLDVNGPDEVSEKMPDPQE